LARKSGNGGRSRSVVRSCELLMHVHGGWLALLCWLSSLTVLCGGEWLLTNADDF
jgi:hypothetical protein